MPALTCTFTTAISAGREACERVTGIGELDGHVTGVEAQAEVAVQRALAFATGPAGERDQPAIAVREWRCWPKNATASSTGLSRTPRLGLERQSDGAAGLGLQRYQRRDVTQQVLADRRRVARGSDCGPETRPEPC
jgi:hypothetical protein